ncbi:MAG TPA: hypothetical protein VK420_11920, partial [Longimicrobium sp.]|nr:hypothetical protein [Longimicrobium sp.]
DESLFVLAEADALRALGRRQEAEERLGGYLARSPEALDVLDRLAGVYLERKRLDALRARMTELLGRAKSPAARALALRYLAQAALAEEGLEEAKAHLREQVALVPDDWETVLRLAVLERRTGELGRALERLDGLVARLPHEGVYDWERMVVGTLLGRWDAVRDSAARAGFDVPEGDGPIDLDGEMCRVRLIEANGEHSDVYAERTGPVTARVVSVALPGYPQHIGDEVVFTAPAIREPHDADAEEPLPLYPGVAVLRPGNHFVFALDGVHPTTGEWAELRAELWNLGVRLSVRSDDRYTLTAPHDDTVELPGVYALVAVPPEVDLERVEALLTDATAGWEHPVVWPGLLEKLGRQEKLARHAEVMDRYGIKP